MIGLTPVYIVLADMAHMDIFNMNVKGKWVTMYARSLYFPKDHSFAIPNEHFLPIHSLPRLMFMCIGKLLVYVCVCVRATGNIIEPLPSFLLNIYLIK
jgi:hypothetical protein